MRLKCDLETRVRAVSSRMGQRTENVKEAQVDPWKASEIAKSVK